MSEENTTPTKTPTEPTEAPKQDEALKALQAEHAKAIAEKEAAKKAEEEATKSLEQRLAEREQALKALEKQSLINKVRFDGGYTAAVFSGFAPVGETAEEIKASYEGFKASVDEYAKTLAPKQGVGGGTGSTVTNIKKAQMEPLAVRLGIMPSVSGI